MPRALKLSPKFGADLKLGRRIAELANNSGLLPRDLVATDYDFEKQELVCVYSINTFQTTVTLKGRRMKRQTYVMQVDARTEVVKYLNESGLLPKGLTAVSFDPDSGELVCRCRARLEKTEIVATINE